MNKKSTVLVYPVLFGFLIAVSIYFLLSLTGHFTIKEYVGKNSVGIIGASTNAENILFYIDQSAKYSALASIIELAENGGSFYDSKCEQYLGYTIWSTKDKKIDECFPDYKSNFKLIMDNNVNSYLKNYESSDLPLPNYDYLVEESNRLEIIGIASNNIEVDIAKEIAVEEKKKTEIKKDEFQVPAEINTVPDIDVSYKYSLQKYSAKRSNDVVDRVKLHHTGSLDAESAIKTLEQRGLSVHYLIERDGTIYYLVDEGRIAYHAKGWNSRSIGIEIVNTGYISMQYTEQQYTAIKNLIDDIITRWPSLKMDNEHIIAHYQATDSGKWDPSPNFDWAKLGLNNHLILADLKKDFGLNEYGYG